MKALKAFFGGNQHDEVMVAANLTLKVSISLRGGSDLRSALQKIAVGDDEVSSIAGEVLERASSLDEYPRFLSDGRGQPWRAVASAWHIAMQVGAPLAPTSERISQALLMLDSLRKKRDSVLSGTKATVMLIAFLPLVSFFVAEVLGLSLLNEYQTAHGAVMLLLGLILLFAGIVWSRAMIKSVASQDLVSGLEFDLVWMALAGGTSTNRAILMVVDTVNRFSLEWIKLDSFIADSELSRALRMAQESGSPIRPLLTAQADSARVETQQLILTEAEKLGVHVLIPLGVCVLPSFILTGVLPILTAMIS